MATRKTPTKTHSGSSTLVPVLRDAVKVVDRALAELGRAPRPRKKRAARAKRKRP